MLTTHVCTGMHHTPKMQI